MNNIRFGFLSSIAATTFGMLFNAALIASLAGLIPSPWDIFFQVLPSLLLAWSYMLMMLCLYKTADRKKSAGAMAGAAFSVIYATINTMVYFTVLTLVIPQMLAGHREAVELLLFEPGKFLFHLNGIAYTLMSVAALFSAASFGKKTFLRRAMAAHGLIAPLILLAVLFEPAKYLGALWIITFPLMGMASILHFKKAGGAENERV